MNIYTISDDKKEKLVVQLCQSYRDCEQLRYDDQMFVKEKINVYACLSLKGKIDHILEEMRLEYAYIIRREYIALERAGYYEQYFSASEYILYKKEAIDSFLHCLYGAGLL